MAILIFLFVVFPLTCYGISLWVRQQKEKRVKELARLAAVAKGQPVKTTTPVPATKPPAATAKAPAQADGAPAASKETSDAGTGSQDNLDPHARGATYAYNQAKDTLLRYLRELFDTILTYQRARLAANNTFRQISYLPEATATDRIRPSFDNKATYSTDMPEQMLGQYTRELLALSSGSKQYAHQLQEIKETATAVQKARQRLLSFVSSLGAKYKGKYPADLKSKLQAARAVLSSSLVEKFSEHHEATLAEHGNNLDRLPPGYNGDPLTIANRAGIEAKLITVYEKRFFAYKLAALLDNTIIKPLTDLQEVPAAIEPPARPTVEEVSRFVTQFENWSKDLLLSLRAAQKHKLETASALKEFRNAIDALRKELVKAPALQSARSPEEALVIVANRFLETSEERYKDWLAPLTRLEKYPLDGSLPVSTSTEAEITQIESIRQLLRKLGFAVAQYAIARQKEDNLASAVRQKSIGPRQPDLTSSQPSYDAFMQEWEAYEAKSLATHEEFVRLSAELETVKAATETRLAQRFAAARLLAELTGNIAKELRKDSSDELRTTIKAALTMTALWGDPSSEVTLAVPAGKA